MKTLVSELFEKSSWDYQKRYHKLVEEIEVKIMEIIVKAGAVERFDNYTEYTLNLSNPYYKGLRHQVYKLGKCKFEQVSINAVKIQAKIFDYGFNPSSLLLIDDKGDKYGISFVLPEYSEVMEIYTYMENLYKYPFGEHTKYTTQMGKQSIKI